MSGTYGRSQAPLRSGLPLGVLGTVPCATASAAVNRSRSRTVSARPTAVAFPDVLISQLLGNCTCDDATNRSAKAERVAPALQRRHSGRRHDTSDLCGGLECGLRYGRGSAGTARCT